MNNEEKKSQLWGGRFSDGTDIDMWVYSQSIQFDHRLAEYDICGSLVHVKMLEECGHLSREDSRKIIKGLKDILSGYWAKSLKWDFTSEDIHSNIEALLYTKIGDVAGKMHMGRSRNDQVALDLHMYCRDSLCELVSLLITISNSLVTQAEVHIDTFVPGYTHMQRAEPIRLAHHFLAYVAMFIRDIHRLQDLWKRVNISPLGAGAFSGSPLPIDNSISVELLLFDGVYENSIDAVSDRDFGAELLFCLSMLQMHISKLSEELVLWSSQEFSFIELGDEFCTGSSMMPQKKNPDAAELARGKTGPVYAALFSLLTTLKGLPLSYNRDLQEDKKPIFEAVDSVAATLRVFSKMIASMKVKANTTGKQAGFDYSNATEVANYLTKKQVPFRKAHSISGQIVSHAIAKQCLLVDLPLEEYKQFSPLIEKDIYKDIAVLAIVEKHSVRGGTAKKSVLIQIQKHSSELEFIEDWHREKSSSIDIKKIITSIV